MGLDFMHTGTYLLWIGRSDSPDLSQHRDLHFPVSSPIHSTSFCSFTSIDFHVWITPGFPLILAALLTHFLLLYHPTIYSIQLHLGSMQTGLNVCPGKLESVGPQYHVESNIIKAGRYMIKMSFGGGCSKGSRAATAVSASLLTARGVRPTSGQRNRTGLFLPLGEILTDTTYTGNTSKSGKKRKWLLQNTN